STKLPTLSVDGGDIALRADALWSVGHFEEAAAAYRQALALVPDLPAANHGMARVLDARGRTAEGLALVEMAIEREPDVPEFRHTRAFLLERLRNYAVAAEELERYIGLLHEDGFK